MTRIPVNTAIPEELKELFAAATNGRQPPLDLHSQMACAPAVLAAYVAIRRALEEHGTLDRRTRLALMLAVSTIDRCECTQAVNTMLATRAGFDKSQINAIVTGSATGDEPLDALLAVSREAAVDDGRVSGPPGRPRSTPGAATSSSPGPAHRSRWPSTSTSSSTTPTRHSTCRPQPTAPERSPMDMTPHVQIILAATRAQRRGAPIARWFTELAAAPDDLSFELIDLAERAPALLANASPPMGIQSRDGAAHEWSQKLAAADGYVVATPEYNHGYSAPLKNALDHPFSEWNRKPIGFISYGASGGGLRAVDQLRQVAIELDMVPIRRQIAIARAWAAISEDGELREPPVAEAQVLLNDIVRWATTLRAGRAVARAA